MLLCVDKEMTEDSMSRCWQLIYYFDQKKKKVTDSKEKILWRLYDHRSVWTVLCHSYCERIVIALIVGKLSVLLHPFISE